MSEGKDRQLAFLQEFIAAHATIAGDPVEIAANTWAIHGSIPVDGDVLLAEFGTQDEAKQTLGRLPFPEHRAVVP